MSSKSFQSESTQPNPTEEALPILRDAWLPDTNRQTSVEDADAGEQKQGVAAPGGLEVLEPEKTRNWEAGERPPLP